MHDEPPDFTQVERHLSRLTDLGGAPALLLRASLDEEIVPVVGRWLARRPPAPLDVVLSSRGGYLPPARKLAHLLRRHAQPLRIFVPAIVRSAGTLVALGGDELVFGDLGELGALDPQVAADSPSSPGPGALSTEDVRRFRDLAAEWFGVDTSAHGVQVLALLSQQVFPPTLATAYRLDRMVTRAAVELLDRQLPAAPAEERLRVARGLVEGFAAHDEGLLLHDVQRAGLTARAATDAEQDCLTGLLDASEGVLDPPPGAPQQRFGLVAAAGFAAWCAREAEVPDSGRRSRWHVADRRPHGGRGAAGHDAAGGRA